MTHRPSFVTPRAAKAARRYWKRDFDNLFLEYRRMGFGEDRSIQLAEMEADFGLEEYYENKYDSIRNGD